MKLFELLLSKYIYYVISKLSNRQKVTDSFCIQYFENLTILQIRLYDYFLVSDFDLLKIGPKTSKTASILN